jgi:hypothetical protein
MRGDHLFAVPRLGDIVRARKLLRRLAILSRSDVGDGTARVAFAGIDYGPLLFGAIHAVLSSQVWSFLVVVAQSRRLHRTLAYDALFVAGAGAEFMGNLVALDRNSGRRVYLMPHGLDLQRFAYPMPASDQPHVTYLAYGSDHADFYVSEGGPRRPVRTVVVGNPLTASSVLPRRGRDARHGKRLLILSFGHLEFWNADRIYAGDRYCIEVFSVARALMAEGWKVALRAHPYHLHKFEERIAEALGLHDAITWDKHATFESALAASDVVVCSASTTCYQALCAGWPTIFYEPDYRGRGADGFADDPVMTGLVTATDIPRPVACEPGALARMIRDTLDPESLVSEFPRRFTTELFRRFVGPDPARSVEIAAEFLEHDIMGARHFPARATADAA